MIPYRTKLRRTKVTKFYGGDEKFGPTKIYSKFFFKCHRRWSIKPLLRF